MISSTPIAIGTYIAGGLLLIGGLGVVLLRSLQQAALAFVGCLLMVAALAWFADAHVVAAVQLGIAVLALIGLRFLPGFRSEGIPSPFSRQLIAGAVAAGAVLVVFVVAWQRSAWRTVEPATGTSLREYLLAIVVAGLGLLIGALAGYALPTTQRRAPTPVEVPVSRRNRDRR